MNAQGICQITSNNIYSFLPFPTILFLCGIEKENWILNMPKGQRFKLQLIQRGRRLHPCCLRKLVMECHPNKFN